MDTIQGAPFVADESSISAAVMGLVSKPAHYALTIKAAAVVSAILENITGSARLITATNHRT